MPPGKPEAYLLQPLTNRSKMTKGSFEFQEGKLKLFSGNSSAGIELSFFEELPRGDENTALAFSALMLEAAKEVESKALAYMLVRSANDLCFIGIRDSYRSNDSLLREIYDKALYQEVRIRETAGFFDDLKLFSARSALKHSFRMTSSLALTRENLEAHLDSFASTLAASSNTVVVSGLQLARLEDMKPAQRNIARLYRDKAIVEMPSSLWLSFSDRSLAGKNSYLVKASRELPEPLTSEQMETLRALYSSAVHGEVYSNIDAAIDAALAL